MSPSNRFRTPLGSLVDDALRGRLGRRGLLKGATALGLTAPALVPLQAAAQGAAGTAEAAPAEGDPQRGGTLSILLWESILGLDLFQDGGFVARAVWPQLYNSLLNVTIEQEIEPALAVAMPEQVDEQTYMFQLREGVKFHDGTDFTADDVVWQYETALADPESWLGGFLSIYLEGVEKVDDYTVRVTTAGPQPEFLSFMAYSHVFDFQSREAMEEHGESYGFAAVAGTGPFRLEEFTPGGDLVVVRNEDYWGADELPYLDRIIFRTVEDVSSRLLQLETGEADVIYQVPAAIIEDVRQLEGVTTVSAPGGTQQYLLFDPREGSPFADKRVRQAISYAIDRQSIVDNVMRGEAAVATSIYPPTLDAAVEEPYYTYDPERARSLLEEAGYNEGNPLQFTLDTSSVFPYPDEAVLIQADLAAVGVQTEIRQLEHAALSDSLNAGPEALAERQAMLYRRGLDGFVLNDYTFRRWHSTGPVNRTYNTGGGIENPQVEQLLNEMSQQSDLAVQTEMARELNQLILEDAPQVFICYENFIVAFRDRVHGLQAWPAPQIPLRTVWVDPE